MLKILFSLHRICIKHVRRWGTSTRQAFLTPSVLRKACPKMGYSHQASFFHTIGFEKASERMGPGHLNHPHKLSHTIGFEKASERMGPARKAPAHEGPGSSTPKTSKKKAGPHRGRLLKHYMAARPNNSYLFISSIMASAP